MDYLADTTFLIGRWRNGRAGAEQAFIARHPDAAVAICWLIKAEFLRGALLARHDPQNVQTFLSRYPTVWPDERTIVIYAEVYAELRRRNSAISPHDLWIAASSLRHGVPILTSNASEFHRVPDLAVIDYRQPEA